MCSVDPVTRLATFTSSEPVGERLSLETALITHPSDLLDNDAWVACHSFIMSLSPAECCSILNSWSRAQLTLVLQAISCEFVTALYLLGIKQNVSMSEMLQRMEERVQSGTLRQFWGFLWADIVLFGEAMDSVYMSRKLFMTFTKNEQPRTLLGSNDVFVNERSTKGMTWKIPNTGVCLSKDAYHVTKVITERLLKLSMQVLFCDDLEVSVLGHTDECDNEVVVWAGLTRYMRRVQATSSCLLIPTNVVVSPNESKVGMSHHIGYRCGTEVFVAVNGPQSSDLVQPINDPGLHIYPHTLKREDVLPGLENIYRAQLL